MTGSLKFLIVAALLALLPLRGLAAATVGFCAAGHHDAAQDSDTKPYCSVCAEHCTGASLVVPSATPALPTLTGLDRLAPADRFAAGHVPDHLDRPPLAL